MLATHKQKVPFTLLLISPSKTKCMKMQNAFMAAAMPLLILWSCKKDDPTPPSTKFTFAATLSGANEVPANASAATGSVTGSYDSTTKILSITVTYSGVTPSAGHIHKAALGVNGPVQFGFTTLSPSPFTFTSVALTAAQQNDLFNTLYYVNLHSTAFPGGEIRGQLTKQ
jgi:hypothetical protein